MPKDDPPHNSAPWPAYLLVGVGVAAIVLGLGWKALFPVEAYWSEQQAQEYEQAYAAAHEASIHGSAGHGSAGHGSADGHDHGHGGTEAQGEISLEDAKAHFRDMHQQLTSARQARSVWGKIISIAGVMLAVTGAWLLRHSESGG